MSEMLQIMTTTPTQDLAMRIANSLVEQQLAACVQISGPVQSVYRWQGKLETAIEWQCSIKTTADLFGAVERAIRQLHEYEVPEIVAMPIVAGAADYLRWIGEATRASGDAP